MTDMLDAATDLEPVEDFRQRARLWLKENVARSSSEWFMAYGTGTEEEELRDVQRNRDLQRLFYDGGFAGIALPKEYGGQGLTLDHHVAFGEELTGYEYPSRFQVPTMQPCAAILTEFGTEEQKR
ncbi:MAG: acyl-CoA dehydrogenase family protein, partial [Acidimicrobiia bacterium]